MAAPNGQTYRLATLRDVWSFGDPERIERALTEILAGMLRAKSMESTLHAIEAVKGDPPPTMGLWPTSFEWVDDGKGEITTRYRLVDGSTYEDRFVIEPNEDQEEAMRDSTFTFEAWVVLEEDGQPFKSAGFPAFMRTEQGARSVESATRRADRPEERRVARAVVTMEVIE